MSERDEYLLAAWIQSLDREERAEAEFVLENLKGDFATAHIAVRSMRLERKLVDAIAKLQVPSPWWKLAFRDLLTLALAVGAAIGATQAPEIPK